MDALQCSGSFKDRGIGTLLQTLKQNGARSVISSSGGNAGLAVANCGRVLAMEVKVIVPETTKALVIEKLKAQGAQVTVHGENWNKADELARKLVDDDEGAEYVHPYDHPIIWQGHSTLVDEIVASGTKPDAIAVCVGGGGLLCGVYEGLKRHGWDDVTVVTSETEGAASFAKAFHSGEHVKLDAIDSIATSLGALQVTSSALEMAAEHKGGTQALIVSDGDAVRACQDMVRDHRLLVEPACGAALAVAYSETLHGWRQEQGFTSMAVVVCGGNGVTPELLSDWAVQHC